MRQPTLEGRRILLTAGPTWVPIDAVRHIGNVSSGGTGLAIARSLAGHGARVTLIYGPGRVTPSRQDREMLRIVDIVTYHDLRNAVHEHVGSHSYDVLIHAAAVSDYEPVEVSPGKLPSDADALVIRLKPTPKIVDEVKPIDPEILLVKFKLEVDRPEAQLLRIAEESRARSGAELIVANDLTRMDATRHLAFLLDGDGIVARVETTEALADALSVELAKRLHGRARRAGDIPGTHASIRGGGSAQ